MLLVAHTCIGYPGGVPYAAYHGQRPRVVRPSKGNTVTSIARLPESDRDEIIQRLKRIEGQARGLQKMVDDGRDCADIFTQISSIRAAVNSLNGELLETYLACCMQQPDEFGAPDKVVQQAVRALVRG